MMKIRFNKMERVAGLFVLIAVGSAALSMISVAVKQGWFDTKIEYTTVFDSADGVHPGTMVQIVGLKAGSVDEVDLTPDNKIFIRFYVLAKYADKIRKDSATSLIRPFVIGERVLDISPGSQNVEKLADNAEIQSQESSDLMTLLGGKKLGNYIGQMSDMMGNLRGLMEAFLSKDRTATYIKMMDHIEPLIRNLNTMSLEVIKLGKQANQDGRTGVVLGELAVTTKVLNRMLPEIEAQAPKVAKDMTTLVTNLAQITTDFKTLIPAVSDIDLPHTTKRAVEALDEAVVLMKAMEKSFLIRGNAKEVREEEDKARAPASK